MSDLDTLIELKNKMESTEVSTMVNNSVVSNPAKEVEGSLVGFLTSRLERLEKDAQFADLIRMYIRQRLPEADFGQLMQLLHETNMDNNRAVESMMPVFQGDSAGKIITEHLKDDSVSSVAQTMYQSADKDVLQAVSYLSSVMAKMSNAPPIVTTES